MTQAKHTPGPWLRDRESGFDCDVRAANGRKIASVNVQNQPKSKEGCALRKKENEANARLIAAAPEMLSVLKMVQDAAIDMRGEDFNLTTEQWAMFHSAIAKAIGTNQ